MLPAARRAAAAFLLCRSQWQYAPSGVPTGLRYADCMTVLRVRAAELGVTRAELPALLREMQVVEWAFLAARQEVYKHERAGNGADVPG
ncbi:hypothetical protein DYQ93_11455 [Xanthomonas sp. LMG 8992]|uniref:DUF1799 domain-containing protein n=1 Tax=Xanthomonas sp. LMG 8992 TaxID=1591157 RepID=UPI00136F2DA7|nr:DUF1799 domain-containing protein [Xanthomonas sp. LMG 8992]MXV11636.1 hypothetical protein [Xanthomonas sp. LMG 8992]